MFVTGKLLDQSLAFNKVAGQACDFIKKKTGTGLLLWILRNFYRIHLRTTGFNFFILQKKNTSFYKTPLEAASDHFFFFIKYQISHSSSVFSLCTSETDFLYSPSSESLAPEHFSLIRTFAKLIRLYLPHLYVFDFQAVTHCSG